MDQSTRGRLNHASVRCQASPQDLLLLNALLELCHLFRLLFNNVVDDILGVVLIFRLFHSLVENKLLVSDVQLVVKVFAPIRLLDHLGERAPKAAT